jgi:hypothetical protein
MGWLVFGLRKSQPPQRSLKIHALTGGEAVPKAASVDSECEFRISSSNEVNRVLLLACLLQVDVADQKLGAMPRCLTCFSAAVHSHKLPRQAQGNNIFTSMRRLLFAM